MIYWCEAPNWQEGRRAGSCIMIDGEYPWAHSSAWCPILLWIFLGLHIDLLLNTPTS